jgi:hypothetical protein
MNGRYSDFEALRPTGEASHIPDAKLNEGCDGEPRRQRVATTLRGYPDQPATTAPFAALELRQKSYMAPNAERETTSVVLSMCRVPTGGPSRSGQVQR